MATGGGDKNAGPKSTSLFFFFTSFFFSVLLLLCKTCANRGAVSHKMTRERRLEECFYSGEIGRVSVGGDAVLRTWQGTGTGTGMAWRCC